MTDFAGSLDYSGTSDVQVNAASNSFWDSLKGVATDYVNAAGAKLSNSLANYSTPKTPAGSQTQNVGQSLFDIMYAYGSGKVEQAKQSLIDRFLGTKTGAQVTNTATQQRIQAVLQNPITWIVLGLVVVGLFMLGKKA